MGGRIEAVAAAMECTDCLLCSVVTMARWDEQVGCFIGSAEARGRRRSRRCSGAFAIPPLPARARFQARTRGDSRAFLLPAGARLSWGGCGLQVSGSFCGYLGETGNATTLLRRGRNGFGPELRLDRRQNMLPDTQKTGQPGWAT